MPGRSIPVEYVPGKFVIRCPDHPARSLWAKPKTDCLNCRFLRHMAKEGPRKLRRWRDGGPVTIRDDEPLAGQVPSRYDDGK
jgi:hypothetical protein